MPVVVIGLEHNRAPIELLERVTVSDADVAKVLAGLGSQDNVREVALLSTCLRTEVYAVVDRFHDAVEQVTELLADRADAPREEIEEFQSVFFDRGVASHLFKIASGLESAVPGESEVLGQVRRSLDRAIDEGTVGPVLMGLFRHAVHTGRRVRAETGIARGTTSFSYAAVELAQSRLRGDLEGSTVVILGAGTLGSGVANALADPRRAARPQEIVVVNRTEAKARDLVSHLDSQATVSVAPFDELGAVIKRARLVISAVHAQAPIVTADHAQRSPGDKLLVVDLGMPRNVSSEVGRTPDVELVDISDLRSVIDQAMDERRTEVAAATEIVVDEVSRYLEEQRGRGAAPVVVALRERLEEIREGDMSTLTPEEREAVEALTRSIVAKLAHEPTMMLKESAGTPRGERLIESVRILFGM